MRRYTRRIQPRPTEAQFQNVALTQEAQILEHTSEAAASTGNLQLSVEYLTILQSKLHQAQVERELWTNKILLEVEAANADKAEARRQAQEEAELYLERQQHEQRLIIDERSRAQRARAAELQQRQRDEAERRLELEATERRHREEQEAIIEAQRIAAEDEERRRRERLRTCVVCMDENDLDVMVQVPCQHWYCRACLRGKKISPAIDSRR